MQQTKYLKLKFVGIKISHIFVVSRLASVLECGAPATLPLHPISTLTMSADFSKCNQ